MTADDGEPGKSNDEIEANYQRGEVTDVDENVDSGELVNNENKAQSKKLPAHFRNTDIHWGWRYGIPAFLIGTLSFLLVADISSGVTAKTIILDEGEVDTVSDLLTVSIVSSVKELWDVGSYALAIFICITSVMWPYAKLILSLVAWMVPFRNIQKRERFIEIVDSLDKWSFVDIFVLTIIMVAFRSSIDVGSGISIEVLIVPKWGFYAFVAANMMSLMGTQAILYQHRQIQYHNEDKPEEEESPDVETKVTIASQTKMKAPVLVLIFVACMALHFAACAVDIYEVSNTRQDVTESVAYSVFSIGTGISESTNDPSSIGIRWIQFMFMLFAVALPPWNTILFAVLYFVPMAQSIKEKVFFLAEITYSWAAVEVLTVSVIFSILQIPKFGNGLIDSGCAECYRVDSSLFPEFALLAVSTALNVGVSVWLFLRAHEAVYPSDSHESICLRCWGCLRCRRRA